MQLRRVFSQMINVWKHASFKKQQVSTEEKHAIYCKTSDSGFNKRSNSHTKSFRHEHYVNDTELSKYIWHLRVGNFNSI